jgi:hypothetical protein
VVCTGSVAAVEAARVTVPDKYRAAVSGPRALASTTVRRLHRVVDAFGAVGRCGSVAPGLADRVAVSTIFCL